MQFAIFGNPYLIGGYSFVLAVILTWVVRLAAPRYGFVAEPTADRWHRKPTAMFGGIAIFAAAAISYERNGRLTVVGSTRVEFRDSAHSAGVATRCVTVDPSGLPQLAARSCT